MDINKIIGFAESPEWLENAAESIQPAVLNAFESAGDTGKAIKNFLHGTWLGHPLHPLLTDIPLGAYTTTVIMDVMELCGKQDLKPGADASLAIGLAGAAGAAVTGTADWTGTSGQNRRIGLMHATLNIGATLLNTASLILRKKTSNRKLAMGLSFAAYSVTTLAAYLGGHLVYSQQMGVDHTAGEGPYPLSFTDAYADEDLKEGQMVCANAGEIPVLLARQSGTIYAVAHTCSHLGGPLSEGELLSDACVKCPWHGSVFSLKDGHVIYGPATQPQPKFETRLRNGKIQVRLASSETIKRLDTKDQE
ncbi:MAG: Rieske 2Fe-2S domain-containing protein [Bacteroidota bacterium]|nr:Rieske 2Fe-2S domain-containing protein [Bacteroidota bacterium]